MHRRVLSSMKLPAVVVLCVAALEDQFLLLPPAALATLQWLPYALLATAALLGWYFRKSRVCFWAAALATGLAAMTPATRDLVLVLLPLNLALLTLVEDRSVPSAHNLLEVAWLMSQAALVSWLLEPAQALLRVSFDRTAAVEAAVLGLLGMAARKVKVWTPLEAGLVQAYLLACAGLLLFDGLGARLLYALAAAALLGSVVRLSYGMAYVDELTELPGRRALTEEMRELGGRYAIAMLDVDHFKKFNDTHGHDVGDQVLRMVAPQISTL